MLLLKPDQCVILLIMASSLDCCLELLLRRTLTLVKQIFFNMRGGACLRFLNERELNYVFFTFTFCLAKVIFCGGAPECERKAQVSKRIESPHQLACTVALPCGDGKLQKVNVQNTNIV